MLSIPHMIVVFLVVLVVFGPHKLPELARGLGKLLAEFRKASADFRIAFEEEMRDLERQAREAERQKTEAAAMTAAPALPAATDAAVAEVREDPAAEPGASGSPGTVARTPDSILPAAAAAPETAATPAAAAEGGEPIHGKRQPA